MEGDDEQWVGTNLEWDGHNLFEGEDWGKPWKSCEGGHESDQDFYYESHEHKFKALVPHQSVWCKDINENIPEQGLTNTEEKLNKLCVAVFYFQNVKKTPK